MHLIKLLVYAFSNRKTIHKVIEEEKEKQEQLSRENLRTHLDLCEKHQPKNPGAICGELSCSHCALERGITYLEKAHIADKKQVAAKTEKSMLEHYRGSYDEIQKRTIMLNAKELRLRDKEKELLMSNMPFVD